MSRLKRLLSYLTGIRVATYQSSYNGKLEVWLVNGRLILNSAHANQSFDSLHRVFREVFQKIDLAHRPPSRILLLGLGGGSVPFILRRELQITASIDAVEIDETMIGIAKTHFGAGGHEHLSIHHGDAFGYILDKEPSDYDLIIADLFHDDEVPEKFFDPAFHERLLRFMPQGNILFNVMVKDKRYAALFGKVLEVYRGPGIHTEVYKTGYNNEVMIVHRKP